MGNVLIITYDLQLHTWNSYLFFYDNADTYDT